MQSHAKLQTRLGEASCACQWRRSFSTRRIRRCRRSRRNISSKRNRRPEPRLDQATFRHLPRLDQASAPVRWTRTSRTSYRTTCAWVPSIRQMVRGQSRSTTWITSSRRLARRWPSGRGAKRRVGGFTSLARNQGSTGRATWPSRSSSSLRGGRHLRSAWMRLDPSRRRLGLASR